MITTLFPGVHLSVSMCLQPPPGYHEDPPKSSPNTVGQSRMTTNLRCVAVQLHRMLAAQHRDAWHNLASLPGQACGPIQVPNRYRAAGARACANSDFWGTDSVGTTMGTSANFSVAVASVSGFAGPAAAAWSTHQLVNRSNASNQLLDRQDSFPSAATSASNRLPVGSINQDRLSLFTEWGSLQQLQQQQQQPSGTVAGSSTTTSTNPFDDSVHGTAAVASTEQVLTRRGLNETALQSIIGTGTSLLDRTIAVCRHRYLRQK